MVFGKSKASRLQFISFFCDVMDKALQFIGMTPLCPAPTVKKGQSQMVKESTGSLAFQSHKARQ